MAEAVLPAGVAQFGRAPEPADGFLVVLHDPAPVAVHDAEVVLCARVPLLSGALVPADGLLVILSQPVAALIHPTEVDLATGVALVGRAAEPSDSFLVVCGRGCCCRRPGPQALATAITPVAVVCAAVGALITSVVVSCQDAADRYPCLFEFTEFIGMY